MASLFGNNQHGEGYGLCHRSSAGFCSKKPESLPTPVWDPLKSVKHLHLRDNEESLSERRGDGEAEGLSSGGAWNHGEGSAQLRGNDAIARRHWQVAGIIGLALSSWQKAPTLPGLFCTGVVLALGLQQFYTAC